MSDVHGNPTTRTPIRYRVAGKTDVGQVREHNEDNFLVANLETGERAVVEGESELPSRGAVFGVCDGMGGAAAGEVASQLAVDLVFECLAASPALTAREELARRLVEAVEQAGVQIFRNARSDRAHRGMGTTSTIGALVDDRLFLAQVGDSRAYVYRGGQLVLATRDQSLVNQLIEAGQLTEQEADNFEHNNIILQALGTAETVQVDLTYVDLRRGDILLMCSDGLSGMIKADEMRQVLEAEPEPARACSKLIEHANAAGGHDNITAIVVKFEGEGLQPPSASDQPLLYRKYQLGERDKRRDTARPGSLAPSSPNNEVPSPEPEKPRARARVSSPPLASLAPPKPKNSLPPPGPRKGPPPLPKKPVREVERISTVPDSRSPGGWPGQTVGAMVVAALVLIAVLGFWLLR